MYGNILVPTDGSEHAIRAAEHANALARAFDATVQLLGAADANAAAGLFDGSDDEELITRVERASRHAIEATEAVFADHDTVRTSVVRGRPDDVIAEYVEREGVDLVAMGTHGRTGIQRYVLGSVTERVVRRVACPVLTVRTGERSRSTNYEEVMIPTDGSEPAAAAVDHGIAVAKTTGARIHAVNMVDSGAITATHRGSSAAKLFEQLEASGERATETVAERAADAGLDVTTTVREGGPASGLLDYADDHGIDLIAMGTTGRTGVNRYLLGSTAERVIRHADMPVFAVNARERME